MKKGGFNPFTIKLKGNKSLRIMHLLLLVAAIVVIWFVISVTNDVFAFAKNNNKQVSLTVPQGASTVQIAHILAKNKVIKYPFAYSVYIKLKGDGGKEKYGDFVFNLNMSYKSINELLKKGAAYRLNPNEVWVTIPEGYEAKQIIELLVSKGLGTKDRFLKAINEYDFEFDFVKNIPNGRAYRLEGYLMPDTYIFSKTEGEASIIGRMLDNFDKKITSEIKQKINQLNMSLDKIIILSSIIEREAGIDSDRALISSVFYNRLNSRTYPYLESCATIQYILGERKKVLSTADTKINNPYNTYINAGLPPGPICSPGVKSLNAALYPADTDYYFFVAKKDGSSLFAKTFEQHNKNIAIADN